MTAGSEPCSADGTPYSYFTATLDKTLHEVNAVLDASASLGCGSAISSYAWNFGEGTVGSGENTIHSYRRDTYTVTLTVTDDQGEQSQVTQTLDIR